MYTKTLLVALFAVSAASASVIRVRQAGGNAPDFGQCTPTMDFQFGRNGRPEDEGTFLPTDPLVAEGQSEALNPNIITNRICDQLTNVCEANDAAKELCAQAQQQVQALGTKDATTADAFNAALGF
ncbi:hypothetical protein MMYC01_201631 [Madurella mycetomatis]|uniref:Uncharacterized protein n=1 Tax=Madurella mycetomatis TaxID=100816 RepID=A0A175W1J6_9PEZI|nr:hypothetical protein MMYC01_206453 [Madurella mycetomatis]KXX82462.1 hypothetical protein MMYC01_201631 [Madurella mycetomatis]